MWDYIWQPPAGDVRALYDNARSPDAGTLGGWRGMEHDRGGEVKIIVDSRLCEDRCLVRFRHNDNEWWVRRQDLVANSPENIEANALGDPFN